MERIILKTEDGSTWVAQSVKLPPSAQVMIPMVSGPALDSLITEESASPSPSAPSPFMCSLSLSLRN